MVDRHSLQNSAVRDIRGQASTETAEICEAEDMKFLQSRMQSYVVSKCPACSSVNARSRFVKHMHNFDECAQCETVFINPRPPVSVLDEYYRTSKSYRYWNSVVYPASEQSRLERIIKPRVDRVLEVAKRHKSKCRGILEIGAGFGSFCAEMNTRAVFTDVVALEPNPDLASSCRRKGVRTICSSIEAANLAGMDIDMVVAFEVIEHLFEPSAFIQEMAQLLSPGGLLVLTCPNVKGFDVSLLNENACSVDPRHLNLFTPQSLAYLLTNTGFRVVESATPGILDAELVKSALDVGAIAPFTDPFMRRVFVEDWEDLKEGFQDFLAKHGLSSHLWVVACKL
jgi:2-polyprenyl-3-methyl-5-hydroxy-6-metoxy-1,4-benzoquinol methylase